MKVDKRRSGESQRALAERVLRENIISMELVPGQLVSENELSQAMGISRTPVREAMGALCRIHMLEVLPQRGCRISLIDYEMIEEARYTRQILETGILPRTIQNMTDDLAAALMENVRRQRLSQTPAFSSVMNFMELDDEFHHLLFTSARMEMSYQMMAEMQIHFDRVRRIALDVVNNSGVIDDHERILQAILSKDAPLAQQIMTEHLARVTVDRSSIEQAFPQYIKK